MFHGCLGSSVHLDVVLQMASTPLPGDQPKTMNGKTRQEKQRVTRLNEVQKR